MLDGARALAGQHQRAAAPAKRTAAGQQLVLFKHPGKGGIGDFEHLGSGTVRSQAVGDIDIGKRHIQLGRARN
ncbi:hypothetical protein D3C74_336110 [compost metagenome]